MFPSMKARALLWLLMRKPLLYRVDRTTGSHRILVSEAGYPRIVFAYHDGATVSPTRVRKILTREVGLTEMEALRLVRGKRR